MQSVRVKLALALAIGAIQSLSLSARAFAMSGAMLEAEDYSDLFVGPTQHVTQHLVSVTSDKYTNTSFSLTLTLNESGSIQKIDYKEKDRLILAFTPNDAKDGVVMLRDTGMRILELFVDENFDPKSGGDVSIVIMRQFVIFNSDYRVYRMRLIKTETGWTLATSPDHTGTPQIFDQIYLETLKEVDSDPEGTTIGTGRGKALGIKLIRVKHTPGWQNEGGDSRDPVHLINTTRLPRS